MERTVYGALGLTIIGALTLLSACGSQADPAPEGEPPMPETEVLALRQAGEVFEVDGLNVVAPQPGEAVSVSVLFDDGTGAIVGLETMRDGTVLRTFETLEEELADELGTEAADGTSQTQQALSAECSTSAFSHLGYKWGKRYDWYSSHNNRPSNLGKQATIDAFRRGTQNIHKSFNNCGLEDQVNATASYLGDTSRNPQVKSDGSCGGNDGFNVSGWGLLPKGTLAVACTYYNPETRRAVNSDVKFNTRYNWYAGGSPPAGCSNRFSVRAVMTHERGHTWGLGHVSEQKYPYMTMSTATPPCTNSASSLGRGDVIGLRKLY